MTGSVVELELPSRLDLVTVARMVVAAVASCVNALDGDRLDDLRWVTSEATTNAIQANQSLAARPEETTGRVTLRIEAEPRLVRLTVIDEGPGMPPVTIVSDITHPDRLELEGGFGVPLMQMLSSGDVKFTSTPTGTTVQMELQQ